MRAWRLDDVRVFERDSLVTGVALLIAIWAIPFVSQLPAIGDFSIPVPVLFLVAIVFVFARSLLKLHCILEATRTRTLLGRNRSSRPPSTDD